MAVRPIPEGYHSVTPYLVVQGVDRLIDFLEQAFGAEERYRHQRPDGTTGHAEVQIGDSIVMMGEASAQWKAMPAALYLYVNHVDVTYRQALQAGAKSLMEPTDMFYGDRSGGVIDPFGNSWWIATHQEDVPPDELARRAKAQGK
jgi:uncharacterized glyoxalase superfamily protein PhnB